MAHRSGAIEIPPGEPPHRNKRVKSRRFGISDPQQANADVATDIGALRRHYAILLAVSTDPARNQKRLPRRPVTAHRRFRASSARPTSNRHITCSYARPRLTVDPNG